MTSMRRNIDRVPFGIRFSIVMLAYLVLSSLLTRLVSFALAQSMAIPIVSLFSVFIVSQRRGFFRPVFYGLCAGLLVFALLKMFS